MNHLTVLEPRWHDNQVLCADWKLGVDNIITIKHSDYPQPFYISGESAKSYPTQEVKTKRGGVAVMRVIPLSALEPILEEL